MAASATAVSVIPVVVFTASSHESDKEKARSLGANDYIVKPSIIDNIAAKLLTLKQRWLQEGARLG